MIHTNYQPARKGLVDQQIRDAKVIRSIRNHMLRNEFGLDAVLVDMQRTRLKYSDRGDFTRCYRGGF